MIRPAGWARAVALGIAIAAGPGAAVGQESADSGEKIFGRYCITCHGALADGKGPAAWLHKPPPADLRSSGRSDEYKALIITRGGAAMGRSPSMPPWGQELRQDEIDDVVRYLGTLRKAAR